MNKQILILIFLVMVVVPRSALAANAEDEMPIAAKLVANGNAAPQAPVTVESAAAGDAGPAAAPTNDAPAIGAKVEAAKVDTAKLPENEIPVLTGAKDSKKSTAGGLSRILTTLGVLTIAFGAAVYGIKRYAHRGTSKNQNTRIKVLTQHALGPRKNLAIVQVAGEAILIGITDQNISMLKTIALIDDEFPESIPRNFDTALDDVDEDTERGPNRLATAEGDDFAVRGLSEIRDKVSTRLRNMKNL